MKQNTEHIVNLKKLWSYLSPAQHRMFRWVFVLVTISAFTEMLTIGALYPFIITLVAPEKLQELRLARELMAQLQITDVRQMLPALTIGFVLSVIAATGMRVVLLWSQTNLSNQIGSTISNQLYFRTLNQPYLVHAARNSNEVIATIVGKVNGVVSSVLMPILTITSSIILLLAIFATLVAVQPLVALAILLCLGGVYYVVAMLAKERLIREGHTLNTQQHLTLKAVQEGLGGIREVLLDGTQRLFSDVYHASDLKTRRSTAIITFISSLPRYLIEGLGMILIALAAYLLTQNAATVAGAVPILGVIALGAQRLLPVAQTVYSSWTQVRAHLFALQDVIGLMERSPLLPAAEIKPATPLTFNGAIRLEGVQFRYGPQLPMVLKGIDLVIPRGARVGVIGSTGSGKSTLIDIVMGLLPATHGQMRVDGQLIDDTTVRAWQHKIAHVPQAIFLADTTVEQNIAFGVPLDQIDPIRLRRAAKQAQIAELIDSMPEGVKTRIGERGVRLSGGQRQRIGIARALYKQAEVIVLDEATSALDHQTETLVMEAIDSLDANLTLIIIAHRLSTLRNCTQVIELGSGELKRVGAFKDLIEATA